MQNMRCASHYGRLKAKVGIHVKCIFPYHQKRSSIMQLCVSRKHLRLSIYRKVCLPIQWLIGNQTVWNDLIHRSTELCRLAGLVGDSKWQYNQYILNTRGIFVCIVIQQKQYPCQHQYSHLLSHTFIANVRTYICHTMACKCSGLNTLICPPACLAVCMS